MVTKIKPLLAVLNRKNHQRELAALTAAMNRANVKREIVVASTILDNPNTWRNKTADLGRYAGIWSGGSGDIDITEKTSLQKQFLTRMKTLVWQVDEQPIPFFGECLTFQAITQIMGGKVVRDEKRWEGGTISLNITAARENHPYFAGLPKKIRILSLHKDSVSEGIPNATVMAQSEGNPYAVITFGSFFLMQPHSLYKPDVIDLFEATNRKLQNEGSLKPFPQTHDFSPIDDCELITVNFFNSL